MAGNEVKNVSTTMKICLIIIAVSSIMNLATSLYCCRTTRRAQEEKMKMEEEQKQSGFRYLKKAKVIEINPRKK